MAGAWLAQAPGKQPREAQFCCNPSVLSPQPLGSRRLGVCRKGVLPSLVQVAPCGRSLQSKQVILELQKGKLRRKTGPMSPLPREPGFGPAFSSPSPGSWFFPHPEYAEAQALGAVCTWSLLAVSFGSCETVAGLVGVGAAAPLSVTSLRCGRVGCRALQLGGGIH